MKRPGHAHNLWIAAGLALTACGMGQQLAAGPVIGHVAGRGWSVGWEAGGGPMTTWTSGVPKPVSAFTHFNVGMSWRPGPPGSPDLERISYAAWEPWLLLGGTFGLAQSSADDKVRPMLGLWEFVPYMLTPTGPQDTFQSCSPCYTVSLAFGWRWSGAREVYLTPKIGLVNGMYMPFPFEPPTPE